MIIKPLPFLDMTSRVLEKGVFQKESRNSAGLRKILLEIGDHPSRTPTHPFPPPSVAEASLHVHNPRSSLCETL